jgi:hypothetical protein
MLMGSVISFGSGQKISECATAPQKLFGETRLAVKPESERGFSPLRTDSLPFVSKIYWPENADDAIMDAP